MWIKYGYVLPQSRSDNTCPAHQCNFMAENKIGLDKNYINRGRVWI